MSILFRYFFLTVLLLGVIDLRNRNTTSELLAGLRIVAGEGELNLGQIPSVGNGNVPGSRSSLGQSIPNPTADRAAISLYPAHPQQVRLVLRDM